MGWVTNIPAAQRCAILRDMTIHPYPAALESEVALRDGTRVAIRPMRPEDAGLETRFVDGLSEQSRYRALYGNIMAENHDMLDLAHSLGFVLQSRGGSEVTVVSHL